MGNVYTHPRLSGYNQGNSWPKCGSTMGSIQEVDQLARFRKPKIGCFGVRKSGERHRVRVLCPTEMPPLI